MPPDEPFNLPEDLMNDPGATQPLASGQSPTDPPTTPYGTGYGQPGYGQPGYGQPGYGYPPAMIAPIHPNATTAMVLGLVGLVGALLCCVTIFACPVAWVLGAKAKREIDASGGAYSGRDRAVTGMVSGIIGTVLLALGIIAVVLFVIFADFTSTPTSGNV